jgi:hypothetical protein
VIPNRSSHGSIGRLARWQVLAASGLLSVLVAPGATTPRAQMGPAPEKLTLFQMTARSDLVALVKVRDGSLRYALVDLVESLKGQAPASQLRIAFRDFNFSRAPDEDVIVFPAGQQEILFLVPYKVPRKKKDIEKFKDLFTLNHGRQGRITLPAEGSEIALDSIRKLAEISRLDAASQVESFFALLSSSNLTLVQASLSEIERLRAADSTILGQLAALLASPSPGLKAQSLRVIAQVFGSRSTGEEPNVDVVRSALAAVVERARNDPEETVRIEAVAAIAAWPRRLDVEGDLRAIAGTDQAQAVRFEAEKALFKR